MRIKSEAKTKKMGVAGWKVGQTWHRNNCSHAKKYNKNRETVLAKQFFSLLIWDRQLKFMLRHPTVWLDRKQLKFMLQHPTVWLDRKQLKIWNIWAKNCFCMIFCTRGRLMYERLWQTVLADYCINTPLKNLSWSYWRLIWRQNCFDMHHWALGVWDALKSFIWAVWNLRWLPTL